MVSERQQLKHPRKRIPWTFTRGKQILDIFFVRNLLQNMRARGKEGAHTKQQQNKPEFRLIIQQI